MFGLTSLVSAIGQSFVLIAEGMVARLLAVVGLGIYSNGKVRRVDL
jgi:hypothetical protein